MKPVLCLSVLLFSACGDEPPGGPAVQSLFPLAVGHSWTYTVTESNGEVSEKTQTVTGTASVNGAAAFELTTVRGSNQNRRVVSLQRVVEGVLVRELESEYSGQATFRSQTRYTPASVRVDLEKRSAGDTYRSTHEEIALNADGTELSRTAVVWDFTVEAAAESVEVPAGIFQAVRVRRAEQDGTFKTYWYVPGIGKVREQGGQTEALTRYSVAP